MRQPTPLDQTLQQLNEVEANIQDWRNLHSDRNFRALISFLETRYVTVGAKECKSLADLAGRNDEMALIRDIFSFMKYDFDEKERLLHELRTLTPEEEGLGE